MQSAGYTSVDRGVQSKSALLTRPRLSCQPTRHSTCQRLKAHMMAMIGNGLSTSSQYCSSKTGSRACQGTTTMFQTDIQV